MTVSTTLPRSTPEAQGISSSAILAFVDAVERQVRDLNSFILLRHGQIVAEGYWEPYGPSHPHMLFSLSKSFTSTAIGFLVADGRLSIDDHVLDFFPGEEPSEPSNFLRAMRVKHLLTMTTGHDPDPTRVVRQSDRTWTSAFLAQPVEFEPGTHFVYNSVATYTLSAIAQRITGQRLVDYLRPRLFAPLGIEHPTWETSPEGIDTGGWGLSITTMDIARFGQLYLQRGAWQGAQILPENWVSAATSRQVPNGPSANPDWEQGYGYQFWRCRHNVYRGDGAFGQYCIVMPDHETVLAITSGVGNMQLVLDLVWQHILPSLGTTTLADDPVAQKRLAQRLETLRLSPTPGQHSAPSAATLSGQEFVLADNPTQIKSIRFNFDSDVSTLTIGDGRDEQQIPCGNGRWIRSEGKVLAPRDVTAGSSEPARVAASGGWSDDQTFVADVCWYETPFRRRFTCRFEGDQVLIDQQQNVGFGPTDIPRLEGQAR